MRHVCDELPTRSHMHIRRRRPAYNSEDIYTEAYNNALRSYGRPSYLWGVKARHQGRGQTVGIFWRTVNHPRPPYTKGARTP